MRGYHILGRITKIENKNLGNLGEHCWDFPNFASLMTLPPFGFLSLSSLVHSSSPHSISPTFCAVLLLLPLTSPADMRGRTADEMERDGRYSHPGSQSGLDLDIVPEKKIIILPKGDKIGQKHCNM